MHIYVFYAPIIGAAGPPLALLKRSANGYSTGVDHAMYGFTIPLPTTPVSEDEREGTHSEVSWMS